MEILQLFILGILLTLAFMLVAQLFVKWKASKLVGREFTSFGKNVILYFYSPHCGMCRRMEPVIEKISKRYRVRRVNVSDEAGIKLAKQLGILGTPATVVIKNGKISRVFLGYQNEEKILEVVKT